MKLDAPKTIFKLQLATRTDVHATTQAKNVRVQVGTSSQYNANDPVCTIIPQLSGTGLMDYYCDQLYEGQYVILSTDQTYITICEAKIFVDTTATGMLLNQIIMTHVFVGPLQGTLVYLKRGTK